MQNVCFLALFCCYVSLMGLSIFSRACFRLSVFLSFLADILFALTFCQFRAMFSRSSFWLCFSALASGYLFSPHFLAGYGSSRAIFRFLFTRAIFRVICSPALSCRLPISPRSACRLSVFRRFLASHLFSRAFSPVTCFPALSRRLCVFPLESV